MKKIFLFLSLFIIGCATTGQLNWTPEQREEITIRTYNADYDTVFNAILKIFDEKGIPLEKEDKDNGKIVSIDIHITKFFGSATGKYYIDISRLENYLTKVKVYLSLTGKYANWIGNDMSIGDNSVTKEDYMDFFQKLDTILNNELP